MWTPFRGPPLGADGERTAYLVLSLGVAFEVVEGVAGAGKSLGWCLVLTIVQDVQLSVGMYGSGEYNYSLCELESMTFKYEI